MGIHNSSIHPIEQRVGNPITEQKTQKNRNMKAFTTACALVAGVSADSQFYSSDIPFYSAGLTHPITTPIVQYARQPVQAIQPIQAIPPIQAMQPIQAIQPIQSLYTTYGVHHPMMAAGHLIKRGADAEPRFTYQTKVEHPDERSVYEYRVNVDRMGNGNSYQFHEQQRDNLMRQQQLQNQLIGRTNGQRMQYNMDQQMGGRMNQDNQMMHQRDNQMMHQRGNQRVNELMFDLMFDRMMEQCQDDNQRQYMRRQDGRMNNFYSYERMLQRQNEARRNMNNRQMNMNNQHRMFKREADSSFEYDVVAEHDNSQVSRNQQLMDVMIRPQQTYQMDNRMNNYMNQRNNQRMQYNMDNRMDGRMNRNNQMMNQHNQHNRYNMDNQMDNRMHQMDSRMHQMDSRRNQMDSQQMDQYNMNNQMDSRRNQLDSRMYQMDSRRNQMDSHRNQMDSHQMDQYNMNNQMTNQMHQGQRQFGDNAFGFNRASMQYDQLRNYY